MTDFQSEKTSENIKNVATFSGGGVKAFIEFGIFHSIITKNPSIKFDMFFGVSGGSIPALVLSYFTNDYIKGIEYIKSKKLENTSIYSLSLNPFHLGSLLSSEPLRKSLTSIINELETEVVDGVDLNQRVPCYVSLTSLNSGLVEYYDIHTLSIDLKVDALIGSSSFPVLLPSIPIKGLRGDDKIYYYQDGGIVFNDMITEIFNVCGDVSKLNIYHFTHKSPIMKTIDNSYFNGVFSIFNKIYRIIEIKWFGTTQLYIYNNNLQSKINDNKHSKQINISVCYGNYNTSFLDFLNMGKCMHFLEKGFNNYDILDYDISMF